MSNYNKSRFINISHYTLNGSWLAAEPSLRRVSEGAKDTTVKTKITRERKSWEIDEE